MDWDVIQGDAIDVVSTLRVDRRRIAIITDNPYGMDNDADYSRFTGGLKDSNTFSRIAGDDQEFDPAYWLQFPFVTLWGYQFLASRLPLGSVLVWNKKRDNQAGTFLSDCELGWEAGGHGVYIFHHLWHGFDRESERGEITLHPNQKPVPLMQWCIERQNLPRGTIIVDPYCGSGTTLVAARRLGFDCIGIDLDAHNCNVARARMTREGGIGCDIPLPKRSESPLPLFESVA